MKKTILLLSCSIFISSIANSAIARDQIRIVGSSTVYPFATMVAERFGRSGKFKTPVIESTGSGGGMKLFCAGVGVNHPDITNASRRIKSSEFKLCQKNGVREITEFKIGYDGIVIATAKEGKKLNLSKRDIFLALAKFVPVNGKLVLNPYKTWKDVNSNLPNVKIEVLGPPPTSGTRDAFLELAMEGGCKTFPSIKSLDKIKFKAVCHGLREDGAYVNAGENDNLIIQKLTQNKDAYGIFGFGFLDQNRDKIQANTIDNVEPTFDNISDGKYPVSRSLFFYVKKAHLSTIPGLKEYVQEFINKKAIGEDGYLADKGLIPLHQKEFPVFIKAAKDFPNLEMR